MEFLSIPLQGASDGRSQDSAGQHLNTSMHSEDLYQQHYQSCSRNQLELQLIVAVVVQASVGAVEPVLVGEAVEQLFDLEPVELGLLDVAVEMLQLDVLEDVDH